MKTELENTKTIFQSGGVVLYPSDTVWGIGCDATNYEAVAKIYAIKQRAESKSLIILVDSLEMLRAHIPNIPAKALEILKNPERPTTIIYKNPEQLATNVIAQDNTVAIRVVNHKFCQNLIQQLGKPIVSTSANISGKPTPKSFKEIDKAILDAVDYVVNLPSENETAESSRILRILSDGSTEVLRD